MTSVRTTTAERTAQPLDAAVVPAPPRIAAERAIVGAEVVLALVLGTIGIGRASFFPDESYTWSTVDRSFTALISVIVRHEAFQVLHTLLEWPVNAISDSSTALRYPSVICFAAAVPPVWALARRLFDARAGLVAGLLFAVNAWGLQYAQEARSYAMAMMFAAYAGAALAREVTDPTPWSRPAWVITSIAAVWSHGMAVFAIVAQVGSLLVLPRALLAGRRYLRAAIVIAVGSFPVVLAPFLQVDRAESFPDSAHPTVTTIRLFVWSMVGRSVFAALPYAAGGAVAVWAAARIVRATGRSLDTWRFVLPFGWLAFPPLFLLSVSFVDPVWVDRYTIASLVPLVVLVAYGLTRVTPTRLLAVVLVVTVATASWGVVRWYRNPGFAGFDRLVATMNAQRRPGDVVAVATERSRIPLEFALRHEDALRRAVPPVFPDVPWGRFKTGDQRATILTPRAARRAATHPRVWLVGGFYDPNHDIAVAVRRLRDAGFRVEYRREYDGPISLFLLERAQ